MSVTGLIEYARAPSRSRPAGVEGAAFVTCLRAEQCIQRRPKAMRSASRAGRNAQADQLRARERAELRRGEPRPHDLPHARRVESQERSVACRVH